MTKDSISKMTKAQWFKKVKQDNIRVKINTNGQMNTKAAQRGLQRLKELGL
jgi:hypothetical protein